MSDDTREVLGVGAFVLGTVVLLFAVIGIPIWVGSYYSQRASCHNFSTQTNRETKFEVLVQPLGLPFSWDCFTRTADGKWIPTKNLREFGKQP